MNATKTYWTNPRFCFFNENISTLIDEVKASNLSTEAKIAVLSKLASYDSRERECGHYLTELVLLTMTAMNTPATITEILIANPILNEYTVQRISARMRQLLCNGIVRRVEVPTGNKIEVAPNYFVDEVRVEFSLA